MKKSLAVWRTAVILGAGLAAAAPAAARDPFQLAVTVDTDTVQFGFAGIEDVIDGLDPDQLRRRFPVGADPDTDFVNVQLDFRGLATVLEFPQNTANLQFLLPAADIDETFIGQGATARDRREDALEQLKDFLQENKSALKRLLTALARFSPIDPLAGNPNSLFSKFQERDFATGFTHKVSQIYGCGTSAFNLSNEAPVQVAVVGGVSDIFAEAQARAAELHAENEFAIGAQFLNTSAASPSGGDDYKSSTISVPISYTWKFDFNPSHKLRFDFPLSATDSDGAASYSLGFGLAYTYPVTDVWTLTPAAGVGATGSEDLGSAGGVSAYSLTSAYTWRLGGFALSMGNSVGQYDALGIKIGDVEAEADISNTVLTNGFLLSGPNSLIARNLVIEYSFVDTRITGDDVYAEYYDEIGVAIGRINTEQGIITSYLKAGLSYLIGDQEIDGLKVNLSARF